MTNERAWRRCPTCGASKAGNPFCSNGFHAPGRTYWPVGYAPQSALAIFVWAGLAAMLALGAWLAFHG